MRGCPPAYAQAADQKRCCRSVWRCRQSGEPLGTVCPDWNLTVNSATQSSLGIATLRPCCGAGAGAPGGRSAIPSGLGQLLHIRHLSRRSPDQGQRERVALVCSCFSCNQRRPHAGTTKSAGRLCGRTA
jgi:hypothetical protein